MNIKKLLFILLFIPVVSLAAAPAWQIVPADSSIKFTATQNGAPAVGEFKKFSGDINFDPAQLDSSKIRIVVDIASLSASYSDLVSTLETTEWFDPKLYPQAIFTSNKFTKTGPNDYKVDGTLTIRDKTIPTTLLFTLVTYTDAKAVAKGTAKIERTQFGVGQGDWAKTDEVKDDVKVDFTLSAVKK